jgi:predicted dehydrogenase
MVTTSSDTSSSLRLGLIGLGRIARSAHFPSFEKAKGVELVAIASRDEAKASAWASEFNVPITYPSYEALIESPEVDALIVALPQTHHAEWVIKALEAGKHVLCEKPLAPRSAEVQAMQAAAKRTGRVLMEAFHHRFTPLFEDVPQLIKSGVIGDVKIIRMELTYPIPEWENDSRADPALDAGVLLEAGCYCVDTIRKFMGDDPIECKASAGIHQPGGFEASLTATLKFPRERIALFHTSMEVPFVGAGEIIGTKGRIRLPELFEASRLEIVTEGGTTTKPYPVINRFATQLEHFADCVLRGATPRISPEDSLGNIRIIEDLLRSAGVR